jgi:CspA family cold shock protein
MREEGTVKWFDPVRGYGFINADSGREVFVHHSSIIDTRRLRQKWLEKGKRVSFRVMADPHQRQPQAMEVRIQT